MLHRNVYSFCFPSIVRKTTETTTTNQPSTTVKPAPCELPKKSIERSEDTLEEKSPEKKKSSTSTSSTTSTTTTTTTTTKKPPVKWSRQRRNAINCDSSNGKRCIGQFFNSPLFRNALLGAPNPNAVEPSKETARYDRSVNLVSQKVQSEKVEDSLTEESILQGVRLKPQSFIKFPFDGENNLSFFAPLKMTTPLKMISPLISENLLHGNINSIESNEYPLTSSFNEVGSSQSDLTGQPYEANLGSSQSDSTVQPYEAKPIIEPSSPSNNSPVYRPEDAPVYRPEDYLPSYEYFPKNPKPSSNPEPYYAQGGQEFQSHHQTFPVGPSSFQTTPFAGKVAENSLAKLDEIAAPMERSVARTTSETYSTPSVAPSGCRCDPDQFNDLLDHMQKSYLQFHNGMIQLFKTFQSQSNCGSGTTQNGRDSSSSPSNSNFDYRVNCRDRNFNQENPELALKCKDYFDDSNVNPSSGIYEVPGVSIKSGGFQNQFMTFADYAKMMGNVNTNSGTLMSSTFDLNNQIVGSAKTPVIDNDRENMAKQLKQHISQYKDPVVAAPAPEPLADPELILPEPVAAVPQKVDAAVIQQVVAAVPQKFVKPIFPNFNMRSLAESLRVRN